MNENQNVDIDREQDNGQITYANEVISTIVSVATTEVDGISAIAGNSGLLGKGKLPRGVRVDMNGATSALTSACRSTTACPSRRLAAARRRTCASPLNP